jgi:TPP-dependent pyruvate/acetoin dehydrogenase alpha subunit
MNWELYEVWSVDEDGHEDLIETTKSLKEAQTIARNCLTDYIVECIIYREDANGDLQEVEVIS